jgi:hypothetical protein
LERGPACTVDGQATGPPVQAFREWLERADISKGPIFRAIDRWEAVEEKALTPQSINLPDRQAAAHISKIVPAVRMLGVGIEWLGDSRKLTASSSNKGQEAVQYGGEGI